MLYISSDHAGFELKNVIKEYLTKLEIAYEDMGPYELDPIDDYPDYIIPLARKVAENPEENLGIVIGWSGQGEAISANKVQKIRAAVYYGGVQEISALSKEHNDTNVLSLGAHFLSIDEALYAVQSWLATPFTKDERHVRRLGKIRDFEKKLCELCDVEEHNHKR